MLLHWLLLVWLMLHSSYAACSTPPFYPGIQVEAYRDHILKNLIFLFRRRFPDDKEGRSQVASACAQAAAVLDTYRSLRRSYLDFHGKEEPQAGMSEDTAAWFAARLNLMLQEDDSIKKNENIRKCLKWCVDACLAVQQTLSQRAFSMINETPSSPGNALNNLLDASDPKDPSHVQRIVQFMLAKCRDENKPHKAEEYVWAVLSIAMAERFFREQTTCAINTQAETKEKLGLTKAALALSWGQMNTQQVMRPHDLFLHSVENLESVTAIGEADKKRIKANCAGIGRPDLQPFWPFTEEPKYYNDALLAIYTVPSPEPEAPRPLTPSAPPWPAEEDFPHHPAPSAPPLPQESPHAPPVVPSAPPLPPEGIEHHEVHHPPVLPPPNESPPHEPPKPPEKPDDGHPKGQISPPEEPHHVSPEDSKHHEHLHPPVPPRESPPSEPPKPPKGQTSPPSEPHPGEHPSAPPKPTAAEGKPTPEPQPRTQKPESPKPGGQETEKEHPSVPPVPLPAPRKHETTLPKPTEGHHTEPEKSPQPPPKPDTPSAPPSSSGGGVSKPEDKPHGHGLPPVAHEKGESLPPPQPKPKPNKGEAAGESSLPAAKDEEEGGAHVGEPGGPRRRAASLPDRIAVGSTAKAKPESKDSETPGPERRSSDFYTPFRTGSPRLSKKRYVYGHRVHVTTKKVPGAAELD